MLNIKKIYRFSFPFIISPVVYDFEFNHTGITGRLLKGKDAKKEFKASKEALQPEKLGPSEEEIKQSCGFDQKSHEHLKSMLAKGEIGLKKNRLPEKTKIENVGETEIFHYENENEDKKLYSIGKAALEKNEVGVITFAGGMGSRWTLGSDVVKATSPFLNIEGKYRSFIEIHLAKSRKTSILFKSRISHAFTTSYLTHGAIESFLKQFNYFNYAPQVYISHSKSIARRVYPMERDLLFLFSQPEQKKDEQSQKVLDSTRNALIHWAKSKGEGSDYNENTPTLRFNPPGHWYELPNLLKNGILAKMLRENPNLKYFLCHNIDTMGAYIDPVILGMHIFSKKCATFEVTPRRIEDKGGGLAKINGCIQLIEGLALPSEDIEYSLNYYNTLTSWISIDSYLEFFGLDRKTVLESETSKEQKIKILESIKKIEKQIPTYVAIKNVKLVWGSGQEDIYPVAQFEKLFGDMTRLKGFDAGYISVSRFRGQQLKEQSQINNWLIDGSFDYLKPKTIFNR